MRTHRQVSERVRGAILSRPRTAILGAVAVLAALLALVLWFFFIQAAPNMVLTESGDRRPYESLPASGETIEATYLCPGGETFTTSYDLGSNELTLTLPDGSAYTLPQVPSADEARFAAFDGSVAFYERLSLAHVAIAGDIRYGNCVAAGM